MVEEDVLVVVAVPVLRQGGGNLVFVEALVEALGMAYVVVVGKSAVLGNLLVIGRKQQMGLIAVAEIGAVELEREERSALIAVVTASVQVVEKHTDTEPFACIDGEESLQMVFAIGAVAARVVG